MRDRTVIGLSVAAVVLLLLVSVGWTVHIYRACGAEGGRVAWTNEKQGNYLCIRPSDGRILP